MNAKKKNNLEETYERIINVALCIVPYEDLSGLVAPEPMLFGTTKDEKVFSFSDLDAMFKSQYKQMAGFVPSLDHKRLFTRTSNDGNNAFITEEVTLTITSPEEVNTIFIRCSCVMEYIDNQWKLTHWHASTPVETENDHWHMEEWKREKEKLQQLVDEQTAALKQNNRELQIEAALEKIRSNSLAMQKSDELKDVIQVVYDQLVQLQVKVQHAGFILDYKDNEDMHIWLADHNAVFPRIVLPYFDCSHWNNFLEAKKTGQNFFTNQLGFEEKNKFYKDLFQFIPDLPEDTKSTYFDFEGLAISTALLETVGLYIENYKGIPFSDEENAILMRFGKVFQQAYTRFLDLQKAEAQAQEAQIEAALEKVRSRTMAMQKSEELPLAANNLFLQVQELGIPAWSAGYCIWKDEKQNASCNMSSEGEIQKGFILPSIGEGYDFYTPQENGELFHVKELGGEALVKHYEFMKQLPNMGEILNELINAGLELPTFQIFHIVYFKFGYVMFITYEEVPEAHDIFKRFGQVFEQTYTRFLDLERAETQARESQIEAALEKVRSRSLAMHTPNELGDVVTVIVEKLKELDVVLDANGVVLCTYFTDSKNVLHWIAAPDFSFAGSYLLPYFDHPIFNDAWQSRESGALYFSKAYSIEEKNTFWNYAFEHSDYRHFPDDFKQWVFQNDQHILSFAWQKNSAILIPSHTGVVPTAEDVNILKRFAKVFEQTYTRFLDLQKAEAQAREAQIESALERVRSRSLAMHHSSELSAVVDTLLGEFTNLEFTLTFCIINLIDEQDMSNTVWAANPETGKDPESYYMKFEDYPFHHAMWDAWKAQKKRFVYTLEGEEKKLYDEYLYNDTEFRRFPKHIQEANKALERYVARFTFFKYSGLQTVSVNPISEDELEILERFGRVFEQAYTRFLDLQKAEAQAREAQIEAALERVRSKSLAMHDSQDLHEVVTIVFGQLESIGLFMNSVLLHELVYDSKNQHFWVAANGKVYPEQTEIPISKNAFFTRFEEARRNGESFFTQTLSKRQKDAFFEHYFKQSNHSDVPQKRKDYIYSCESLNRSTAIHKYTALSVSRYDNIAYSKEENKVIKRFSQVFEQSYQRYLDLKKAEAQAREAQIVASMERVRAATMAMHQSNELSLVLSKLFEQFDVLGIKPSHAVLTLIDKEKNTMNFRTTGKNGYQVLAEQEVDLNVMNAWVDTAEKWKKSNPNAVNVNEFPPEILPEVWEVYKDILASMPKKARPEIKDFPDGLFITEGYCRFGYIGFAHHRKPTEEEKDIVRRIAAEFGTLYQRFLDLKKSEAQAREAQIETALEKVRSRTMAMQKGEELQEVAVVLYKELLGLGVTNFVSCGYVEVNEKSKKQHTWVTAPGGDTLGLFHLPLTGDATFDERYAAWKNQQTVFHQSVAGEVRSKHLEYAITTFNSKEAEEMVRNRFPDPTIFYCFNFSHGYLHLVGGSLLKKEEEVLLARFTKVFQQTYTRFLDLQKAEAQAREAQIETALERVRSRTMAMQSSDELTEAATEMFSQIEGLGLNPWSCGFNIFNQNKTVISQWVSTGDGRPIEPFDTPASKDIFKRITEQSNNNEPLYIEKQEGIQLEDSYRYMASLPTLDKIFEELDSAGIALPKKQINHAAYFKQGYLMFITYDETPEFHSIFKRFAKVFEQTYTRFLDLQKAEAQARETQVEMALERVRSRTMAMQHSDELIETSELMFEQVKNLDIELWSCGFSLWNDDDSYFMGYNTGPDGKMGDPLKIPLTEDVFFTTIRDAKRRGDDFLVFESEGRSLAQTYSYMDTLPVVGEFMRGIVMAGAELPKYQVTHCGFFSHGHLMFIALEPNPEAIDIFKRFTSVFEQTYTRFLDLKKSEKRAREAEIDLSLERVRSQVTAMQASSDLFDIVVNMRKEFVSLGHTADYFWHMRWLPDIYEMSMTSEDGNRLGMVINVPKFVHDQISGLSEWEKGSDPTYVLALNAEEAWDYIENMNKYGDYEVADPNAPTKDDIEHIGGLTFIIARTSHGEIGYSLRGMVPNPPNDAIDTLMRLAGVFDLAYKRYEDLQESEQQARLILEERDRLEIALNKLTATQDQLVQQEKLASLGQLTAGIAHEIKNPLNFVNNFSEVSVEMIEEALEEIAKIENNDHATETAEILTDIKANLGKIHEHGSRADGIVKSMLQHSRGSSGKKEPTDLNALIKEYVNLSFHGMRAGKTPINVEMVFDLDQSMGDVPLIVDDFSRVIINLCNNGFDAMRESLIKNSELKIKNYSPKLTVRTKTEANTVTIEIEDNGPGIPDEMKDKILQPFFTTKKGTEGTGLGLSITHDIVKAHGGELSVNSTSGSGTTFKITLKL